MKNALITLAILPFLGAGCWFTQKAQAPDVGLQVPSQTQEQRPPAQTSAVEPKDMVQEPLDPLLKADQNDYVKATDQTAGIEVKLDYVLIHKPGFVVIHEDKDGQPGGFVAAGSLLNVGEMREAFVKTKTQAGKTYWAVLHSDNGDRNFDAKNDLPIRDSNGATVMAKFKAL